MLIHMLHEAGLRRTKRATTGVTKYAWARVLRSESVSVGVVCVVTTRSVSVLCVL